MFSHVCVFRRKKVSQLRSWGKKQGVDAALWALATVSMPLAKKGPCTPDFLVLGFSGFFAYWEFAICD